MGIVKVILTLTLSLIYLAVMIIAFNVIVETVVYRYKSEEGIGPIEFYHHLFSED